MKPTVHDYRGYVFTISYRAVEPIYAVDFADFPEIITSGDSLTQAFAHACEALDLHLESLRKLGLRVPRPKHRLLVETQ
jgi:predicted RNase H-like HicB family nuclease